MAYNKAFCGNFLEGSWLRTWNMDPMVVEPGSNGCGSCKDLMVGEHMYIFNGCTTWIQW